MIDYRPLWKLNFVKIKKFTSLLLYINDSHQMIQNRLWGHNPLKRLNCAASESPDEKIEGIKCL